MSRVSRHTSNHGNHPPGNHGNRDPGYKVLPTQTSTPDLPEKIGPVTRAPGLVHHSGLTTHSLLSDIEDQGDLDLLGTRDAINNDIYIYFLVTVRLWRLMLRLLTHLALLPLCIVCIIHLPFQPSDRF